MKQLVADLGCVAATVRAQAQAFVRTAQCGHLASISFAAAAARILLKNSSLLD